jgi:acetyl-CoA synthetase
VAHLGTLKAGAVSVPLSVLFGPDALGYRLADSGSRVAVTDAAGLEKLRSIEGDLLDLALVLVIEDGGAVAPKGRGPRTESFWEAVRSASQSFAAVPTASEDPALLFYTSGTTGGPKGVLHAHRFLHGSLPAVELVHDGLPRPGDLFWTPADWAWVAAFMDVVLPSWYFGLPVLATPRRSGFDPEWALSAMAGHRVRNAYLPPTALRLIRQSGAPLPGLELRSVMTGGEVLGEEVLEWGREALGVTIDETYGQTEANLTVGNASAFWPVRPGSMGRAYPGHDVRILRPDGSEAAPGETGQIAVSRESPATFLGYWNRPAETAEAAPDGWIRSGDQASRDDEGYLWFAGRDDDLINSSGFRMGPVEIEDCLQRHRAVALAGVVGVPDEFRGQAVKAFLVLRSGERPSAALEDDIRRFVRERLAAHQYPRHIEFVEELPLTTSGKIRRRALREGDHVSTGPQAGQVGSKDSHPSS